MSDDIFDAPGSADQFSPKDHESRLLLIKPLQQLTGITTANGAKDAIEADIHFLDGPQRGQVLKGAYVFPLVLQGQIKSNAGSGRFNLGRLGKGAAKPGQNPPWKLADPTDDEKAIARQYVASDTYKANNGQAAAAPASQPAAPAPAADPWATNSSEPPF